MANKDDSNNISMEDQLLLTASNDGNAVEVKRLLKKLQRNNKNNKESSTGGAILDAIVDPTDGATPLHKASRQGHVDICDLLVNMGGANVNVVSTMDGSTPLHYATYYGTPKHVETVSFLLDHGADDSAMVPAQDEFGMTPLHHASQGGFDSMVKLLLDHNKSNNNNVNREDKFKYTPLHFAAQKGRLETAKLLLDHGARIDAKTIDNHTPLALAVLDGDSHLAMIEFLLNKGADITGKKKAELFPIHLASREGQTLTVQILLNHGADVKGHPWGSTPLHLASVFSKLDTAKFLLDHGAVLDTTKDYVEDLPELLTHSPNPSHNLSLEVQETMKQQKQEHQERLKQMAEKYNLGHKNNSSMNHHHIQHQLHTAFYFFLLGAFLFVGMSYWRKQKQKQHGVSTPHHLKMSKSTIQDKDGDDQHGE